MENENKTKKSTIIFITAIVCIVLCIPIGIVLGRTLLGKNEDNNINNNTQNNLINEINNVIDNTQNIIDRDEIVIKGLTYLISEVVFDIDDIKDKLIGFTLDDLNNIGGYGDSWNNDNELLNRYDLLLRMSTTKENYVRYLVKFVMLKMNVEKEKLNKKYMNFNISIREFMDILNRYSEIAITETDLIGLNIYNGNSINCDSNRCNIYDPFEVPPIAIQAGNIIMSKKLQNTTLELGYVHFWDDFSSCKYYKDFTHTKLLKEVTLDGISETYKYCKNNYNSNEYTTVTFEFKNNDLGGYKLVSIKEK